MKINIRKAELKDTANLAVLKQQVWIATYATEGIRTEFSDYVLSQFTKEKERELIENPDKLIFVAEIDNHIIACVELALDTKCSIPEITSPEITVLYVLERFCGKNIGKMLLEKTYIEAKKMNFNSVWLTVYHENERAIKFYKRNKFKELGSTYFEMDGNKYENRIMIFEIKKTK